ncbi:MAG: hypothetical protein ACRDLB_08945 [Actinomycetota bacterium]
MINKTILTALTLALGLGALWSPAEAKKSSGAASERTYFLRRSACGADDNLRLSIKDGVDIACADMQAGLVSDVAEQTGTSNTWVSYPAQDGVPLVLDATKPFVGEITLYASGCAAEGACVPQGGIAAGNATLRLVSAYGETCRSAYN